MDLCPANLAVIQDVFPDVTFVGSVAFQNLSKRSGDARPRVFFGIPHGLVDLVKDPVFPVGGDSISFEDGSDYSEIPGMPDIALGQSHDSPGVTADTNNLLVLANYPPSYNMDHPSSVLTVRSGGSVRRSIPVATARNSSSNVVAVSCGIGPVLSHAFMADSEVGTSRW